MLSHVTRSGNAESITLHLAADSTESAAKQEDDTGDCR